MFGIEHSWMFCIWWILGRGVFTSHFFICCFGLRTFVLRVYYSVRGLSGFRFEFRFALRLSFSIDIMCIANVDLHMHFLNKVLFVVFECHDAFWRFKRCWGEAHALKHEVCTCSLQCVFVIKSIANLEIVRWLLKMAGLRLSIGTPNHSIQLFNIPITTKGAV